MCSFRCCCLFWKKFVWAFIGLITAALCAFELYLWAAFYMSMSSSYMGFPYRPSTGVHISSGQIPYPRVTICSRTVVNASYYNIPQGQQLEYAISLMTPSSNLDIRAAASDASTWIGSTLQSVQQQYNSYASSFPTYGNQYLLAGLSFSYQCGGLAIACVVNGNVSVPCCLNSMNVSSFYGPCFQMRAPGASSAFQLYPGMRGEWKITLFVDQNNFQKFQGAQYSSHPGFYLFLDANDYFLSSDPIHIAPGFETFITMRYNERAPAANPQFFGVVDTPYSSFIGCQPNLGAYPSVNFLSAGTIPTDPVNDPTLTARFQSLQQYESALDQIDQCTRQCLANAVYQLCGCYPLAVMASSQTVQGTQVCTAAFGVACASPYLNGSKFVTQTLSGLSQQQQQWSSWATTTPTTWSSWQQVAPTVPQLTYTGSGTSLQAICSQQCPRLCLERATIPSDVMKTPLNIPPASLTQQQAQTATVHLYYSAADFIASGGMETSTSASLAISFYSFMRQIGLSTSYWSTAGLLIISIVALFGCCCSCCMGEKQASFGQNFGGRFQNRGAPMAQMVPAIVVQNEASAPPPV